MSGRKLQITLLADEWKSSKGGLSTMNRELAIELAKQPHVAVTFFVPKCTEEDKKAAGKHNIRIVEAEKRVGFNEPLDWLSFPPRDLVADVVIGHGVKLGKQAQVIRDYHDCCSCWVQVVHTAPEEMAMFKNYSDAISKGDEKQWDEVNLCIIADFVVAVGPKLQEFYSANLSSCGKDVINLTPGIVTELSDLELSTQGNKTFRVLVFGRGDPEDFELKGFDIAAKAVAELNDRSYRFIFVGATSGNEEQVTEKLLEQGLSRNQLSVKGFIENRDDLATLLSTANLVVIPSRTEGFGLTALEALSAGLPFLVCQNSGFGEALQEITLASSWIVDSEDPKKWAEAIEGVRKKGRKSVLKECQDLRTRYAEKYNWEKQCNNLVETMLTFVTDRKKELPISPEYDSGFMSLEDPLVSSEKTISFIHCFDLEGEAFKEEVLKLYHRFGICLGYNCLLDKSETIQVAENKFRYVLNNVQKSNFVFICVSPELKRIFDSSLEEISNSLDDDEQCMVRLASDMILAEIAVDGINRKGKFMTIILKGSSKNDVPYFMKPYRKYHWPKDELPIRVVIEGKPKIVHARVGNVKTDPPPLVVEPAKLI